MSFNYRSRGKTSQQQAIMRQREREEKIRREETEREKEKEKKILEYEFDYESLRKELTQDELSNLVQELNRFKDTIVKEILHREKIKEGNLSEALDIGGNELIYQTFNFEKPIGNIIKITKK